MPSLTIKGLPDELHRRLKRSAAEHGRSINREVLACLDRSLRSQRVDAEAMLARADAVRERLALPYLTDAALREAKGTGRP